MKEVKSNAVNSLDSIHSRAIAVGAAAGLMLGSSLSLAADDIELKTPSDTVVLDKVVVSDEMPVMESLNSHELTESDLRPKHAAVSDTAKLLEDSPGVSLYGAGGVSSLPVIHGFNDDRVKININGMTITSACANHMNPPLSYIDRTNVGKITILSGVTPVSLGGDSIGGTVNVESADPVFAEPGKDILLDGGMSAFYRSNGDAFGGSISAGLATQNARIDYTGSHSESMNYNDANGDNVQSSAYENQNHAASLSFKHDNHLVVIRGGQQRIPFQGFPNARMDLTNNESIFGNIMHKGTFDWGSLETKAYFESTQHSMDIGPDKHNRFLNATGGGSFAPPNDYMPMESRGRNLGYKILAEIPFNDRDTVRFGNEYHSNRINDYWPAVHNNTTVPLSQPANARMAYFMMGPENYINLNNAERERVGFFGEWEAKWSPEWKSQLGLRYDHTNSDTGNVQPYNPDLLFPAGGSVNSAGAKFALDAANEFNAKERERSFDTFDVTALLQFTPNDMSQYELGYARKNRAPNLYELYTWGRRKMDMAMSGWFGDGNGYVGNLDLTEETAHTVSFTAAFHEPKGLWEFKATPYFTYVNNFIDADRCLYNGTGDANGCRVDATSYTGGPAINNLTVADRYVYLQYANHDARLWGMDVSGRAELFSDKTLGDFSTRTVMSYVRGERMDGGNLYHMMPFNMKLALDHRLGGWDSSVEMQFVDRKDDVQFIRNETETPSYILLNARTGYEWQKIRFDVGLDNVLDKQYYHPLAGAYLGDRYGMNPTTDPAVTVPWGRNVPGMGRSLYVGVSIKY